MRSLEDIAAWPAATDTYFASPTDPKLASLSDPSLPDPPVFSPAPNGPHDPNFSHSHTPLSLSILSQLSLALNGLPGAEANFSAPAFPLAPNSHSPNAFPREADKPGGVGAAAEAAEEAVAQGIGGD